MGFHQYRGATSAPASILLGASDRSPARLNRSLRMAVESEIERLIDMLDTIEPDADLEDDGGDEPSLASPENQPRFMREHFTNRISFVEGGDQSRVTLGTADDREDEHDGREPEESGYGDEAGMKAEETGEHSLGATEDFNHDLAWSECEDGGTGDGEEDCDLEPNLSVMRGSGSGSFGFPVDVSGGEFDL